MRYVFVVALVLSQLTNAAQTADEKAVRSDDAPQKVIVVSEVAKMGVDDQIKGEAPFGEILIVARLDGEYCWIPAKRAWIRRQDIQTLPEAIAHFTTHLETNPQAKYFHVRGIAYASVGKNKLAMNDFDHAIQLAPDLAAVYVNRGNLWRTQGKWDRARQDYDKAIELAPDSSVAYHNRGMTWADLGDSEKAIRDATQAIEINPRFASAYNNRGVYYREQGKYEEAIADYNQAVDLDPQLATAFGNRGFARKELHLYEQAVADYRQALTLDPNLAQAHNDLAWLRATCPDDQYRNGTAAVQHAREACELSQFKDWNYLDTLAAAYAETEDFANAIEWCRKASKLAPTDSKETCNSRIALYRSKKPFRDRE